MVRNKCELAYHNEDVDREGIISSNLCGMCAIASFALLKSFQKFGIKSVRVREGYCMSMDHCWIQVGLQIYDITATQFDDINDKVYVTSVYDGNYLPFQVTRKNYHQFTRWPKNQRPTVKLTRILKVEPCEVI